MRLLYDDLFPALWIAFLVYFWFAAGSVKAEQRVEPVYARLRRTLLIVCAALIMFTQSLPLSWLYDQLLPRSPFVFWVGAAITAAGLLFAVWARVHIGSNWSSRVTLKLDHQLITSGPYAIVRHPIYTGILTACVGTAVAVGQARGVAAFLLILAELYFKWRMEESWMRQQFGQTYIDYARRVPAIIPHPM